MTGADRAGCPAAHDRHAARMAKDRPGNVRRMVAGRKQRPPSDDIGRNRQGGMERSRMTAPCGQRPLQTGDGMPSRLPGAAFASDLLAIFPQPGGDNLWCESLQKNLGAYACKRKDVCRTGRVAGLGAARGAIRRVSDADEPNLIRNLSLAKPPPGWGRYACGQPARCPCGKSAPEIAISFCMLTYTKQKIRHPRAFPVDNRGPDG